LSVALGPSAADKVGRRPDHLRVVSDLIEFIVFRGAAVGEESLLREPGFRHEVPAIDRHRQSTPAFFPLAPPPHQQWVNEVGLAEPRPTYRRSRTSG
jgi:hypothetical protein